ncbi:MAG: hypothetical protein JSU64_04295 [candidate division WOR-3 bacterium]|nr:MAG: hypothetical protein JSU64_04295 [candidate division WOR-3 bacterium]
MKKFMILILLAMIFVACDYASDSLALQPDIEITWINPLAWPTFAGDSTTAAMIDEIHFVAENSLDSYLKDYTIEYYINDSLVHGPTSPLAIYGKISGIVEQGVVDTFKLLNVPVPLAPARDRLSPGGTARAVLRFVAIDEYFENTDTADVWFGILMF